MRPRAEFVEQHLGLLEIEFRVTRVVPAGRYSLIETTVA
jgi:hypothetical protein